MRPIRVHLSDRAWWMLATEAEHAGIRVHELVSQIITTHLTGHRYPVPHVDRVTETRRITRSPQLALLTRELRAAYKDGYRTPQRNRKATP